MCDCDNVEMGSFDNQVCLPRPAHMYPTEKSDWICVDRCLMDEILQLWREAICTTGCCCGHNQVTGYIGVMFSDIPKMKKLGYVVAHNRCRPKDEDSFKPKTVG